MEEAIVEIAKAIKWVIIMGAGTFCLKYIIRWVFKFLIEDVKK